MNHRSFAAIVAIGVVALSFFAIAGYYLGESSPKVRIKREVERAQPLIVDSVELVRDAEQQQRRLVIAVTPNAGTLTALQAIQVAALASEVLAGGEVIPMEFDRLVVEGPDGVVLSYDRSKLQRRLAVDRHAIDLAATLGAAWGAPPSLRVIEARHEFGLAIAARPGARDDQTIARDVFLASTNFAFVEFPAREPGAPNVVIKASDFRRTRPPRR